MKLPIVLSERFLAALPEEERKRLGRAGITAVEAFRTFRQGEEKTLQQLCVQWLELNQIYYETDRMDRKTSGKKGRADFRICVGGLWLSAECKAHKEKLADEQLREAERLIASGGRFILVYGLYDLLHHVRRLERIAQGLARDSYNYRIAL
jgi:hypothetical protein